MTSSLDARLRNLLQAIDTSPGFDERVMARVRAELDAEAERRAAKARAEEIERYERARRMQSWGAWVRRLPALDILGVAVLAAIVGRALWVPLASGATVEFLSMYAFQILTWIGALLVLAPLPALLLLRRRAAE
jgi:hypothetical protein